ncbi:MAG: histidine--tRNA ligase, partial [Clostridia bacterium]
MIKKPRGTADILPSDALLWQYIEKILRKKSALFGFEEIRFPTFEATELFARGVGDTTDIVQKEMYTFFDKDERSMSLRPEGTACVARSILENGLLSGALPIKLYYIANFFRYEKPQAGRSREFFQFGTELYGADSPQSDATVILLADSVLKELKLKNYQLHINSIGCSDCRPNFKKKLVEYFEKYKDDLCPTCNQRLLTNPLRILDCKSEICKKICLDAPKTLDCLCDECKNKFDSLSELLTKNGRDFVADTGIVRGLDYYTGTVFEFIQENIGAQSTLCGGGRYNGLVTELGGPATPAVGFGMGISRLILSMQSDGVTPQLAPSTQVYIAPLGENAKNTAFVLTQKLRAANICADTDIIGRSLKAQMKFADKRGAEYVIVIGDNEIAENICILQNMQNGNKKQIK